MGCAAPMRRDARPAASSSTSSDPALRSDVLALVDGGPTPEQEPEAAIGEMQADHSSAIRALVGEYIAELGVEEVRHAG